MSAAWAFFLFSLLLFLVVLAVGGTLAWAARSRILAKHRVDPTVASGAPATWLGDPRAPARLHRRLVRVGAATSSIIAANKPRRSLRKHVTEPTPLEAAALELRDRAVTLDHQLTRLAVLAPRARRAPLAEAERSVRELEDAAARLVGVHSRVSAPDDLVDRPGPITETTERIDLIARAHEELAKLDGDNGLRPHDLTRPTGTDPTAVAGNDPTRRPPTPDPGQQRRASR